VDIETAEVIEQINLRINAQDVSLRAAIREECGLVRADLRAEIRAEGVSVRDELRAEIRAEGASVRDELRTEIRAVRDELGAKINSESASVRSDLRAELREGFAENRRYTELLFESLRDDIRMLAEGYAAMSTKLDSLQR
jgi:hypothetical protein